MPKGGSKKGERRGGRGKGTPNKTTAVIKEMVAQCFTGIGGLTAFQRWATKHPTEFYTKIATRLIPHELTGAAGGPLPLHIELTDGPQAASRAESGVSQS